MRSNQRFAPNPLLDNSPKSQVQSPRSGENPRSEEGPSTVYRLPSTLFWLAAWLNLVFVVGVWAALRWGADRWWWATFMAYMPRWTWAAPLVGIAGLGIGGWIWRIANCKLQIANCKSAEAEAHLSRRSALVPLLLATVWVAWPLMGLCVPWSVVSGQWSVAEKPRTTDSGQPAMLRVRVLTCNVGQHAYDPIELAALIAENDPDLIALQEDITAQEVVALVPPGWHVAVLRDLGVASRWPISDVENLSWTTKYGPRPNALRVRVHVPPLPLGEGRGEGGADQITADEELRRSSDAAHPHPSPLPEGEGRGEGGLDQAAADEEENRSGGATRPHPSPLPEGEGIDRKTDTPATPDLQFSTPNSTRREGEGTSFDFVAVHFFTPRGGLEAIKDNDYSAADKMRRNMELRSDESARVRRWIETLPGPVIVAGDMNMPPESALFHRDWGGFSDAFTAAGFGYGYTYGYTTSGWFFGIRIDHVLADQGWHAEQCRLGRHVGSDHRPVIGELLRRNEVEGGAPSTQRHHPTAISIAN